MINNTSHALAEVLAEILVRGSGLRRISLPSSLSPDFVSNLVSHANFLRSSNDYAFHVSRFVDDADAITPESAAEFRSREDGAPAEALLANLDGASRDLATLEPFLCVNPQSIPRGIADNEYGELSLDDLAAGIAKKFYGELEADDAEETAQYILCYLGEAYRSYGNADISWKAAWWQHIKLFLNSLREYIDQDDSSSPSQPHKAMFAAAGLPHPDDEKASEYLAAGKSASSYARQVLMKWQSGEDATISAMNMARIAIESDSARSNYALRDLPWARDFDAKIASLEHPILALSYMPCASDWAEAREAEFFGEPRDIPDWKIFIQTDAGDYSVAPVIEELDPAPYILRTKPLVGLRDQPEAELGDFFLYCDRPLDEVRASELAISTSLKAIRVEVMGCFEGPNLEGSGAFIKIRLSTSVNLKNPSWKSKPITLDIEPDFRGSNVPSMPDRVSLRVLLVAPNFPTLIPLAGKVGKQEMQNLLPLPDRRFLISEHGDVSLKDDARDAEIEINDKLSLRRIYAVGESDHITVNGQEMTMTPIGENGPDVYFCEQIPPAERWKFIFDGCSLEILRKEQNDLPLSPIVAAAEGKPPGTHEDENVERELLTDIRGVLEKHWLPRFYKVGCEGAFPLMVIPSAYKGGELPVVDERAGVYKLGGDELLLDIPSDLSVANGLERFWAALHSLGLDNVAAGFTGITSHWPSRLSLLNVQKSAVEEYLNAYISLVHEAQQRPHLVWLLFPFSAALFDYDKGKTKGFLLSPLHPLRFAWCWSVQYAASELAEVLEDAASLLRFIDGGDLPMFGPLPGSFVDSLLASCPLDSGLEDLYVGWSYLADLKDLNSNEAQTHELAKLLGFGTPSGLDRGGVAAAIHDYLRVFPYLSEMRIGLHAERGRTRSSELDKAVVGELGSLLKGRIGQLPGGVTIYDSKNRGGPAPHKAEVLGKIRSVVDAFERDSEGRRASFPFEWRVASEEFVDIRFLEDPLVDIHYEKNDQNLECSGFLSSLPLRRGQLWEEEVHGKGHRAKTSPSIGEGQVTELNGYAEALRLFEGWGDQRPVITSEVKRSQQVRGSSYQWLVAGSENLNPRILAKSLTQMGSDGKVLWEWRPPYLPRRWKDAQIKLSTANPYTVVASLSKDFRSTVENELALSLGPDSGSCLGGLFEELGIRGVGIASLLAMGHSQSRGAVGFYLGFKIAGIWEEEAGPDELRMALPLDAVNPILEQLAQNTDGDDLKKADLLLISIARHAGEEIALTFCPVEIKNHAANTEPHVFPRGDGVKDALEQLRNSERVIGSVVELLKTRPRPALVNTTMAAVLETGAMLSKGFQLIEQAKLFSDAVTAVAKGECAYVQGPSVLLWFERFGQSKVGQPYKIFGRVPGGERVQLFVNPERLDLLGGELPAPVYDLIKNLSDREALFSDGPKVPAVEPEKQVTAKLQQAESKEVPIDNPREVSPVQPEKHPQQDSDETAPRLNRIDRQVLEARYELVIDTLDQYKVNVLKPTGGEHILEGPAAVVYRVTPASGVLPEKINSKLDGLKLALGLQRDQHIRIDIDSGYVEITVPKPDEDRSFVSTQQLWAMWTRPETELEVPLGIDQRGEIVRLNFSSSQSPHLLIGGTTGSGKSEALNTILWGMLKKYSEEELRLLLIDPKGTELQEFEDLPWVEGDLGVDAVDALEILDRAVREMEARYVKFAGAKVKNIADYIKKVGPMPWWVIVLDEYADLTIEPEDKRSVEQRVKKLSAKARAAGIHLIIATQKPTVDVIDTVLKSNLPASLALRVKSSRESMVIMEETGAETLTGKGDAFLRADNKLTRLQCALHQGDSSV